MLRDRVRREYILFEPQYPPRLVRADLLLYENSYYYDVRPVSPHQTLP
jgi:hypothetical protein